MSAARRRADVAVLTGAGLSLIVFALAFFVHNRLYRNDLEHAQDLQRVLQGQLRRPSAGAETVAGAQSLDAVVVALAQQPAAIGASPAAFYDDAEGAPSAPHTPAAPSTSPPARTPSWRRGASLPSIRRAA
jgi:hypothetical protein